MQESNLHGSAIVPVNGSEATPEGAALVLLQLIANAEGKFFDSAGADKKWILDKHPKLLNVERSQLDLSSILFSALEMSAVKSISFGTSPTICNAI
jgi:hypothetical protein